MRISRVVLPAMLLLAMAGTADGQALRLGVEGGHFSDELGNGQAGLGVTSELSWGWRMGALRLGAEAMRLGSGVGVGGIAGELNTSLWSKGMVALMLAAHGAASASGSDYRSGSVGISPRVRLGGDRLYGELGAAIGWGGHRRGASVLEPGGLFGIRRPSTQGGFEWRRQSSATAAIGGGTASVSSWLRWTASRLDPGLTWTDWTGGVDLDLESVDIGLNLGHRSAAGADNWVSLRARIPLTSRIDLIGGGGSSPADPSTGRSAGTFASLGINVGLGGGSGDVIGPTYPSAPDSGATVLSIEAAAGARVEVAGDWTDWEPVALREISPGRYRLELHLDPGVYRFGFLIDGRWTVPEGYPTEPDEYGGRRAVLRL